jgi:UDP-N-acetylglucosamine--N-acetylmuramyl-(pentapeptide) pyrophosphoryl-undecaprenol N-acetylglucosamine transferase
MTIVLTGGGTAGHCLPCMALLPSLRGQFSGIVYIGGVGGIERDIALANGIEYYGITTVKLRRSFTPKNLFIPLKLWKGIAEAKQILRKVKPAVVFSKGGFVALPVVLAAAKLKIPVIVHESDLTVGMANRLAAKKCAALCTTFPQTAGRYKNAVHTGAIIRAELYCGDRTQIAGFTGSKPNLLIMGGSSGAAAINAAVWGGIDQILAHYNVLHITGRGKGNPDITKYNYVQCEYMENPYNAFAWADVVVSRAGSGTVCELLALRKPTVFVPLPKDESRGDQIDNANYISRLGCCNVLFQQYLTADNLLKSVGQAIDNSEQIAANCEKLHWLDGTDKVAEIIIKYK